MNMNANISSAEGRSISRLTYAVVFLILAVITVVEVMLSSGLGISQDLRNVLFALFSLSKAALVAAFYMHLKTDSRIYLYVFLVPVLLLIVFAYVAVRS
jgi:caa(3)-type oxidase subunit IV